MSYMSIAESAAGRSPQMGGDALPAEGVAPLIGRDTPPIERHSLRRYPNRGLLGGVGAGVAEHLDIGVRWVRLAIAMLVILGGLGVAVYALAWALIPIA